MTMVDALPSVNCDIVKVMLLSLPNVTKSPTVTLEFVPLAEILNGPPLKLIVVGCPAVRDWIATLPALLTDIVPPEVATVALPASCPVKVGVVIDIFPFVSVCANPFVRVTVGAFHSTVLLAPGAYCPVVPARVSAPVLCTEMVVVVVAEPM